MARKLRVQYPGAIYHVINRGDRREPIFRDELDHRRFLATLGETCAKTGWQVHAYCLMSNHFHLVIETPQANLVAGMKWFLGTYTSRFNRRHKLFGHLFSGRYKALIVEGSGNGYLRTVCDYVHLNPVRANLLTAEQSLRDFRWSSYSEYLKEPAQRVGWVRVEMGIPKDSAAGREQFRQCMEERRAQESGADWKAVREGWCLGAESFRQELLAQVGGRMGEHHYGAEQPVGLSQLFAKMRHSRPSNHSRQKSKRAKSNFRELAVATRLRRETTVTLKWITQRLAMGAWTHLNRRLYEQRRAEEGK
jgi:REP element-mobilizing transposase RayT